MTEPVKLIECPRDAWQGLPEQIPTEYKAAYLKELIAAGFKHIDAVSFVSPKHVKQMADSEEVMPKLNSSLPAGVAAPEIIGIVVNEKGLVQVVDPSKPEGEVVGELDHGETIAHGKNPAEARLYEELVMKPYRAHEPLQWFRMPDELMAAYLIDPSTPPATTDCAASTITAQEAAPTPIGRGHRGRWRWHRR